jgi:hypothetical protein
MLCASGICLDTSMCLLFLLQIVKRDIAASQAPDMMGDLQPSISITTDFVLSVLYPSHILHFYGTMA